MIDSMAQDTFKGSVQSHVLCTTATKAVALRKDASASAYID